MAKVLLGEKKIKSYNYLSKELYNICKNADRSPKRPGQKRDKTPS